MQNRTSRRRFRGVLALDFGRGRSEPCQGFPDEYERPYAGAMFAGASVYFLLVYVVVPLLALLLLWLIIYSAVRAALTAHRRALAAERTTAPDTP